MLVSLLLFANSCSYWEEDEPCLCHWHSAAIALLKKKKRKGQEAKLFGFNSFSSCPDLTHLNIYSPAVKPRGLSLAFYCVVMTQSSSPRNYVPFGYFSISRFTPNQHSVSMQEVVCLYVAKLKVRLRRIGVVYGRVALLTLMLKFGVHVSSSSVTIRLSINHSHNTSLTVVLT